jgi:hypothetical protein
LLARVATKTIRGVSIAVWRASAMLRIMLPVVVPPVHVVYVVLLVVVIYVLVVVVNVDVAVTPATTPAPAPISPGRSDRNSSAERKQSISSRVVHRRIRIGRRAIDNGRVVRGDVNNFRIGLLNHDHVLAFDRLAFHFLLLTGF